jgi:hypothetical protein
MFGARPADVGNCEGGLVVVVQLEAWEATSLLPQLP